MSDSRHCASRRMTRGLGGIALIVVFISQPQASEAQEFSAPSVVRAQDEATLSSVISGTINALPFEEGAAFRAGEVLVDLDCAIYKSEAAAARAESTGARAVVSSREALFARGGTGRLEVDMAKAEAAAAAARAQSADLRVDACKIHAPYDGRVAEHVVSAFEYVEPGQPVLSIVSTGTPDLEIVAPADWLRWVEPGTSGRLRLEARREEFNVTIETLGPIVDPVSRTVKLTAAFDGDAGGVLPGLSGLVTLQPTK